MFGQLLGAASFNAHCKHAGKKVLTRLLRGKAHTQASALTHDSNLSEKSPGRGAVCVAYGAVDAAHRGILWQLAGNDAEGCGEGSGCFK